MGGSTRLADSNFTRQIVRTDRSNEASDVVGLCELGHWLRGSIPTIASLLPINNNWRFCTRDYHSWFRGVIGQCHTVAIECAVRPWLCSVCFNLSRPRTLGR